MGTDEGKTAQFKPPPDKVGQLAENRQTEEEPAEGAEEVEGGAFGRSGCRCWRAGVRL